jgi:O-antigen ligase
VAAAGLLLLAYLWTAYDRLGPGRAAPRGLLLLALAAALVRWPFAASLLVFFAVPFFGNHPGGRHVELLNLPVAGAALGLAIEGWRRRRAPPSGWIWLASLAVVVSAALALVPALPAALVRAAQVNSAPLALVQALVAAEGDPLYSGGAFLQLVLCVLWAASLRWAGAEAAFAHRAIRAVFAGVVSVVALGALRFHGLIDLRRWWFDVVDPSLFFDDPMQSIFWNPGWFAGYFVLSFGLSLGLLWRERPPWRWIVATLLASSCGYFLLSRQRTGIAAAVAVVLLFGWLSSAGMGPRRRLLALGGAFFVLVAVLAASAALTTDTWQPGASRLLADPALDEFRSRLWRSALLMWRAAPVFGVGEGAFCWRFREFVAPGSALDMPFSGDAHNTWLQVLATRGLFGLAGLLALLFALVVSLHRMLAGEAAAAPRGLGIGLACALFGAFVYSVAQGLFYIQALQVLFWGTIALVSAVEGAEGDRRPRRWPWGRAATATGLALLLAGRVASARPEWAGLADELARQPRGFYPTRRLGNDVIRWSSRRGVLCLYPRAPLARLGVDPGQRPPDLLPVTVTFRIGHRLVDRFELDAPGRVERAIPVPDGVRPLPTPAPFGECRPEAPALRLEVEVSNVWTRIMAKGLPDYRHLGVAISPGSESP